MTPLEARQFLEDHHIKFILAQFVDIHGTAKTKAVPASHYEDILSPGAGFAGFALWGFNMLPNSPDFMAVGDPSTLSLVPWMPGFARMVCIGHVQGKPYPYDARYVLMQQIDRLRERGWTLNTGIEPEFALLCKDAQGRIAPADATDTLEKPCYDYKGLSRSRLFIETLVNCLQMVGFDVYQIDHEDANGQFEINYTYSDCLTSADRYIFFKMAASEIAKELGLIATFMPKPFADRTGTGMHLHLSIWDETHNLFADDSDQRQLGLSTLGYHFLGGLLTHAPALAAICAPTINSYKRLVVGRSLSGATWAPAYISYGDNNRSSMVRAPGGRLELRLADGSCNPYLATAAVIAAGLDGIEKALDPGEPSNFNLYDLSSTELAEKGIRTLPQSLKDAIDALVADEVIRTALGPLADEFIKLKQMEWVEYMRHVSEWEVQRYLEFF
ncbi:type III glutamate--ammonia ligase [Thermocoleostomius sinensis]|uniref:Type III glutamate--ammonia ligase n=1 Tax=Thermocoleostomius sinensis A174 TaxID=2016057 RepID=A0A9E9C484_9CYAN|nr:type III glutamate--ammonia ligase [Thermocoleostomius sinensis]WAL59761.1 type III glutamate--ammonia ligase [Thermocoleostomius sinensis A174]